MRLINNSAYTDIGKSLKYSLLSCILLQIFSILLPVVTTAQEEIHSEYRVTFVPTYPVSKKVFLTGYLGYVNVPNTNTTSYYIDAPFLVTYRLSQVVELMAGAFVLINNVKDGIDNTEFRPLAGLKLYLPNDHHMNIFSWTRYEFRSFYYDDENLNNVKNRIRNRLGIEFPLSKNAWAPKTTYGFTDFELFYTFEKGYFDRFRQRFGFGYVIDKQWRAEMIYHIQLLKNSKDLNPVWTDNIFRLNIKLTLPHRKHGHIAQHHDIDD